MPRVTNVLIVDDDKSIRDTLGMILRYESYRPIEAQNAKEALQKVKARDPEIDCVICDVKMQGMDGLECLAELKKLDADLPVIMISGHGNLDTAVTATRRGAYSFIEKPLDQNRLMLDVRNAIADRETKSENKTLRGTLLDKWKIIGDSGEIRAVRATIAQIAPTDARVLVTGENGTGKELVARNLHALSRRSQKPFIDVNCAAIPSELIESELLGHEKGAFTGAAARKIGKFEQADGGTLFLDEIGDMDKEAQAKVLRVLETGELQRVGGDETLQVDVRVVAATNRDLEKDVREGRFREDLLYRLNVIPIHLPPLRERPEDIVILLAKFVGDFCKRYQLPPKTLSPEAIDHMRRLQWPGNVRELRNFVERMVLLVQTEAIGVEDLERLGTSASKIYSESIFSCATFEEFKEMSERLFLEKKLRENEWNIKRTAEVLGMQRSNLYKKIDRYNLK